MCTDCQQICLYGTLYIKCTSTPILFNGRNLSPGRGNLAEPPAQERRDPGRSYPMSTIWPALTDLVQRGKVRRKSGDSQGTAVSCSPQHSRYLIWDSGTTWGAHARQWVRQTDPDRIKGPLVQTGPKAGSASILTQFSDTSCSGFGSWS